MSILLPVALGAMLFFWMQLAFGQQAPPPCETQLDQLQDAMLRLKKAKAEVDWQAATFEEMAKALKKQVDAAKTKAEEKKP